MRFARMIRKDTLLEEGEQLLERPSGLRRLGRDDWLRLTTSERVLNGLLPQGCEMFGDEIGNPVAEPAHGRVVELER